MDNKRIDDILKRLGNYECDGQIELSDAVTEIERYKDSKDKEHHPVIRDEYSNEADIDMPY